MEHVLEPWKLISFLVDENIVSEDSIVDNFLLLRDLVVATIQ
jgi:hypothetical protein